MRAVVHDRYGPPEVLRIEEVERPVAKADEVLVRIHATTVTRSDSGWRLAKPLIARYFTGWRRPRRRILGGELAGEVEAVGASVTEFAVGDRVFGAIDFGAHAEYAVVRESRPLATMPAGMTFEEAAAVCDGFILASGCLKPAHLEQGRRIVVYGASGSIGTAAVQIARHLGADVTAVCDAKNMELVRSLGADRVIDHTTNDFTKNGETYDVIFDRSDGLDLGCGGLPLWGAVLVAWTVWLRLRGVPPASANVRPRRIRADYPVPNDPGLESAVFGGAVAASWLVATIVGRLVVDAGITAWPWPGLFVGALVGSLAYAWRRVRADDRRQRRRLAARLLEESGTHND